MPFSRAEILSLPGLCSFEEIADQVRNDDIRPTYFAKNGRTGIGKNCAKNSKKGHGTWDEKSRDAINRVSSPFHHLFSPGLDLLVLLYQDNCEANLNPFI
jgi:hypothetical protein